MVDAVMYHPDNNDRDPPSDVLSPLEDANLAALNQLMLFPVSEPVYLHLKMATYKSENIYMGWTRGAEIASILADDAERAMSTHAELKSRVD